MSQKSGHPRSPSERIAVDFHRELTRKAKLLDRDLTMLEPDPSDESGRMRIPTKAPVCNGIMPPGDSGIMAPPCNGMIPPGRRVH